ncbi:MAG: 1-hydroxycarotenoid 3,4-desaturase CrtD [Steroidobacteraceae bacterium]
MNSSKRTVVIGAGIAGLAASIDLARSGHHVTLIERAETVGGKLRSLAPRGRPIDGGPTVFTMRHVFESLFADAGSRLEDHLTLHSAAVLARHTWFDDPSVLDLHADPQVSLEAIRKFAGSREAQGFQEFLQRAGALHECLREPFMMSQRPSTAGLMREIGFAGMLTMWRTPPWLTLWRALAKHFRDPRLRQLFARYATYVGSSPLQAPATLMLIAHVEQSGVWLVEGGMHRVAEALASLARRCGVTVRVGSGVQRIQFRHGHIVGVHLDNGDFIASDNVIFNGDTQALADGLLGDEARSAVASRPRTGRGLSAVTWCVDTPTSGFDLAHHNVFFGDDYPREFTDIFEARRITDRPTIYVCAQDRGEACPALQPGDSERLLILVNAPADGDRLGVTDQDLAVLQQRVFSQLEASGLVVTSEPEHLQVTRPQDFERLFPATGGSLYGSANHGAFASFERPTARTKIPGLYLAGGSVHPGPGVPMATLSGRLAAACLMSDQR